MANNTLNYNNTLIGETFFYFGYICLFLALFTGDIVHEILIFQSLGQYLRLLAYVLLLVSALFARKIVTIKEIVVVSVCLCLSIYVLLKTKDAYFCILTILVYSTQNIDPRKILKISFILLTVCTVLVVSACFLGFLPNVITKRGVLDVNPRFAYGFYHSDVLPLELFYFTSYLVLLEKKKTNIFLLILITFLNLIIFKLCNSRNSFILIMLIVIFTFLLKFKSPSKRFINYFYRITKYIMLILSFFSLWMTQQLLKGGIYDTIDSLFSGRFRAGIFKIRDLGLTLINLQTQANFEADNIVLDNGYLYIAIRYGIIFLILLAIWDFYFSNKAKNNIWGLMIFCFVAIANMVDNDLVDYSCLPLILIAFSKNNFFEES